MTNRLIHLIITVQFGSMRVKSATNTDEEASNKGKQKKVRGPQVRGALQIKAFAAQVESANK